MNDVPFERQPEGGDREPDVTIRESGIRHEEAGHEYHHSPAGSRGEYWSREAGEMPRRRLSWGAIFAGLFVAIGSHLILGLFGVAIGLSNWSVGGSSAGGIATSVGLWALVSALIALFLGGATTGHLAGRLTSKDGFLHGAILWSLATLATIWLVSNGVGFLLGGAFNAIGRTAAATLSVAGQAATEIAPMAIQISDPNQREQAAADLAQRSGMSVEQAREVVASVVERAGNVDLGPQTQQAAEQRVAAAEARAREAAQNAADTTARGAWWTLLALGLSLGAAGLGATTTAKE